MLHLRRRPALPVPGRLPPAMAHSAAARGTMLLRSRLCAPRSRPLAAAWCRAFSENGPTTFYSSQSGVTVDLPQGIHLHLLSGGDAAATAGSASIRSVRSAAAVGGEGLSLCVPCSTEAEVDALPDGCVADIAAAVGKVDGLDPDDSISDALACVAAAHARGLSARVTVLGAVGSTGGFTPDAYDLQAWTAELADAGSDVIVLGCEPGADEDDLDEVCVACKEVDILGVPMRYRLGLRIDPSCDDAALEELVEAALSLDVQHFDACLQGEAAPKPSALLRALTAAGRTQYCEDELGRVMGLEEA